MNQASHKAFELSIAFLQLIALAGCALEPKAHSPTVVTKEVLVPVRVPCLSAEQMPIEPRYTLDDPAVIDMNLEQRGVAALQEIEQRRDWQREAKALLIGCTK